VEKPPVVRDGDVDDAAIHAKNAGFLDFAERNVGEFNHEVGHVLQHAQGYVPLTLRSAIAPAAGFMSMAALPLFLVGFIFRIPGVGSLLISSILANDTPVIMAITFVFACLVVVFNLLADLLYGWLDPRISYR